MPHVALVPFTSFRIREERLLELGMSLPGLKHRAAAIAALPALGLLTLAGMTPPRWTCSYQEASRPDDTLELLLAEKPNLVAVSALTASIVEAYRFCDKLRQAGIRVVIGGLHVTTCPEEAAEHADAVVVGEGEPVWRQVLADAEAGSLQPRYQSRELFDLEQAPVPRFDFLGSKRRPRLTLQTQRGCPLACDFCGASRLLGAFREKPLANIRRELAAINVIDERPLLELADDNTFAGSRNPADLLDLLAQSRARWFTEADWRIGTRPEVLARLARAGCVQVLVGIESQVHRHAGMGPKQADWRRVLDAVEAIQQAGVAVNGCFIVGSDGETRQSLNALAEFILASPLAEVQLTLQTPFPGTPLFRRLQREGRLLPERGWPCCTLFDVAYQPDRMSVAELETAFCDLIRTVFSGPAVERRHRIRRQISRGASKRFPHELS